MFAFYWILFVSIYTEHYVFVYRAPNSGLLYSIVCCITYFARVYVTCESAELAARVRRALTELGTKASHPPPEPTPPSRGSPASNFLHLLYTSPVSSLYSLVTLVGALN